MSGSPPDGARRKALLGRLKALGGAKIAVLGDFAADHYLVGMTSRISREAPVLILKKLEDYVRPGQAGNSAANLAALGCKCFAFGAVGKDADGEALLEALGERGVDASGIVAVEGARTIVKTRVLSGAHHTTLQQVIRLDDDEGLTIPASARRQLIGRLEDVARTLDAILISDYGYGTVNRALWNLIGRARRRRSSGGKPALRILDSRYGLGQFKDADVITPNETEVFTHLGIKRFAGADPVEAGRRLLERTRAKAMIMTRGNEGMIVFDGRAAPKSIPIFGSDEVTDVTGAGDTVAATIAAVLASGGALLEAAQLANIAAGLVVMKRGAATVSVPEIERALRRGASG